MLPDALRRHPVLARFQNVSSVGRGAFGQVFKATDPEGGRDVAIKMLMLGQTDEVLRRFSREAEALRKLASPYLVELLEVDFESDPPCLVMEWIPGGVLSRVNPVGAAAHPAQARGVARDLLAGVQVLHQHGMIHRDIKPANVFLRQDGLAVLGDFGMIGGEVASTISRTGQALGTPKYMPPEVLQGMRWETAGDLFAVGLTVWEFAVGVHPNVFFGHSLTLFLEPTLVLPTLEEAGAYPNPALQALLDALLERAPGDRPPDVPTTLALLGDEATAAAGDAAAIAAYRPPTREIPGVDLEARDRTQKAIASRASRVHTQARDRAAPTASEVRTALPPQVRPTQQVPASRVLAAPVPPPPPMAASLAPRVAVAAALGALTLLGAVHTGRAMLGGGGTTLPDSPPEAADAAQGFPADLRLEAPTIRFLEPGLLELAWATPVRAFARGSARTPEGIEEFTRGPSTRPTRLTIPAPRVGSPYSQLSFVLEDRLGGTRRAALPPSQVLHSLEETANQFLTAAQRGASLEERRRLFAPLAELHAEGRLRELDADLHRRLEAASSDL